MSPSTRTRADRLALVAILLATLAGTALRLSTVTWGAPFLFHPDERGFVMWEAAAIEWRGLTHDDWRPRTTTYGPVVYELAIASKWLFLGGIAASREEAARYPDEWSYVQAGLEAWDDGEPYSFLAWTHLVRALVALASGLAVALMGLAAWRLRGPLAGGVTAWLVAGCAGWIQASHLATTDSLLLVEIAMLLDAASRLARRGGIGSALYAGVALGLMAATKMTGLLTLAVIPVAIAASATHRPHTRLASARSWIGRALAALATRRFGAAVLATIATYALFCPWAFFDRDAYYDVPANRSGTAVLLTQYTDHDYEFYDWRFTYNGTTPFLYVLANVLPYAVGLAVLAAAVVELSRAPRRREDAARIALAAALPTFLLIGPWGVKTIRYAMPIVPGLLLAAGVFCARALARGGALARTLAVLAIALGLARGLALTAMFWHPDPRVLAGRWLLDRAHPGDVVVVGPEASYTAPLGTNDDGVGVERPAPEGLRIRRLWQARPEGRAVAAHLDAMLHDARFLVVGDFYLRRGLHPEARERAPTQARFYRALVGGDTGFELVATFPRAPCLGPLCWDEENAEILAVAFDHMPVRIYERRGPYRSPFVEAPSR